MKFCALKYCSDYQESLVQPSSIRQISLSYPTGRALDIGSAKGRRKVVLIYLNSNLSCIRSKDVGNTMGSHNQEDNIAPSAGIPPHEPLARPSGQQFKGQGNSKTTDSGTRDLGTMELRTTI